MLQLLPGPQAFAGGDAGCAFPCQACQQEGLTRDASGFLGSPAAAAAVSAELPGGVC